MITWRSRLVRRVRALLGGETLDRELDAEMRLHIDLETEDLVRTRGLRPEEARRQALVAFGGVERYKEAHRDARGVRRLDELTQDLRYAWRGLRRSLAFSIAAVLVLGLGIGSTTAVFSAVNAVLLDPDYDGVAVIFQQNSPSNRWTLSTVDFRAIEAQQRSFSAVGALRIRGAGVSAGDEPVRALTGWATGGFFRALGVQPVLGRVFGPADETPGAPPVVLVSHAYAERTFGDDASAMGRTLTIDGIAQTVVGVLPADVRELAGLRAEIWPVLQLQQPSRRGPFGLRVIGRLSDGVTLQAAARDLAGISERIFPLWAEGFQDREARLTPVALREVVLGNTRQMLAVFSAAVALVLLVAVANVASLMLVRVTGRWREITLRRVLGATRGRLVRLLVTESVVLAGAGALVGIAFGVLALKTFVAIGPYMPRLAEARLDIRAVEFAAGLALLVGVIIGAYPVAVLLRQDGTPGVRDGDRTVGAGRRTQALRGAFVVAQFALSLPVLAGAGLLLNSFLRLQQVNPGFEVGQILTVRISLPSTRYPGDSTISGYWAHALPLVRQVPGVVAAGLGSAMPPSDNGNSDNNFDLIDRPVLPGGAQPVSPWPAVTADFFPAIGVRLLEGRLFTPGDSATAPPVVVVSRSWAQHYFPDGTALGRQLISGGCTSCPPTTIVGVVGDVKYDGLSGTADAVYNPLTAGWFRDLNLFVQTAGAPAEALDRVRAVLRSVDPGVPLEDAAPMQDRLDASVAQPRHWTALLGSFALAALALAAVGVFGMLSYTVSARRREIGVRMALGARPSAVVGMIVQRGMGHAALGAGLGLAVALAGTRWLAGTLFDVSATDPATLGAVTLLLLAVSLVACWLPARRAAAIDPVEAIRLE